MLGEYSLNKDQESIINPQVLANGATAKINSIASEAAEFTVARQNVRPDLLVCRAHTKGVRQHAF